MSKRESLTENMRRITDLITLAERADPDADSEDRYQFNYPEWWKYAVAHHEARARTPYPLNYLPLPPVPMQQLGLEVSSPADQVNSITRQQLQELQQNLLEKILQYPIPPIPPIGDIHWYIPWAKEIEKTDYRKWWDKSARMKIAAYRTARNYLTFYDNPDAAQDYIQTYLT